LTHSIVGTQERCVSGELSAVVPAIGRPPDESPRRNVAPAEKDGRRGFGGLRDESQEIVTLVVDYIKQETIDPVKGLGRYVVFGMAGSVALSIGLLVLSVGFLRLLQTETGSTFTGNLSWVPYVICAVVVVLIAGIAVRAISRGQTPSAKSDKEPV
jgi:Putative Actinobacterial Holin-X, holin superfamily III